MPKRTLGILSAVVVLWTLTFNLSAEVKVYREKIEKADKLLDEKAIVIENKYLKAVITTNQYAGQMMSLIYKPTGQELAPERHAQGYFKDRVGHNRYFWRNESEGYQGRIVSEDKDKVVVETSYTWNFKNLGKETTFKVSKTFTLHANESRIHCVWKFKNTGDIEVGFTPWMKQVGGMHRESGILTGPSRMVFNSGGEDMPSRSFNNAVRGWQARTSGKKSSEKLPMVYCDYEYSTLFQHFSWSDKARYTLETIYNPVKVAPGKTLTNIFELSVAPNIGYLCYATPELAAGIAGEKQVLETGKANKIKLEVAVTQNMGEIRFEGDITPAAGGASIKLPHRNVTLVPGKIATAEYDFTPPADGVYNINITLFSGQTVIPLGKSVKGQEALMVIPLVAGTKKPEQVVAKWKAGGAGWKTRKMRKLKPLHLAAKNNKISVGQFNPLTRIYPVDKLDDSGKVSPVMLKAAANEWESMHLFAEMPKNSKGGTLSVSVGELSNSKGKILPAPEAYDVKYVNTTVPSGFRSNYYVGKYPDPLWKTSPQEIKGGDVRDFWFAFRVPKDAKAGTYIGKITLSLDDKTIADIPVHLTVRNFALPDKPSFRVNTGRVGFYSWKYVYKNFAPLGMEFKDDKEARKFFGKLSEDWWRICTEYGISPRGGNIKQWEKYMNNGRGMTQFNCAPPRTKNSKIEQWLKKNDLLKYSYIYLTNFDEHADSEVPEVIEFATKVRKITDIPIADCYYGGQAGKLVDVIDIFIGQGTNQPWAPKYKKDGGQFWTVNSSLIWYLEFEPVQGRSEYWSDFAGGLDGRLLYSNIRWSSDGVYNKNWSVGGNYVGCTIYPAPEGLGKSIRLEATRDGIEDYDYLFILRERLNAYRKAGRKDKAAAEAEATAILGKKGIAASVGTPETMYMMREKIAALIEKLK